ncbi:MAG TPA: hypothetical protein PKK30_07540, partial [Nitrospira sp.]|nr:hypothetical protein [Nitrospira sp.]
RVHRPGGSLPDGRIEVLGGAGWPEGSPVLAQRAASESPRWTRAVEALHRPPPDRRTRIAHDMKVSTI